MVPKTMFSKCRTPVEVLQAMLDRLIQNDGDDDYGNTRASARLKIEEGQKELAEAEERYASKEGQRVALIQAIEKLSA